MAHPRYPDRSLQAREIVSGARARHLRARPPRHARRKDAPGVHLQARISVGATPPVRRTAASHHPNSAIAAADRPRPPGLRLQALHSIDAAHAYRLAIVQPVRGAYNLAADPVLDPRTLGDLLGARPLKLPVAPLRAAVAAAWNLHLLPASPTLVDLALSVPIMDTARARAQLGWDPSRTSLETIREFLEGLKDRSGMDTPPLQRRAGGRLREKEVATGVGQRATP